MPYEPRRRRLPALKILIPMILAVLVFISCIIRFTGKEEVVGYQIGNLSIDKTKELLEAKASDTYTFSDYFFYGECLNLLHKSYNPEKNDDIHGKSIILKDLCSDNEISFVVGTSVDSAIQLGSLEAGFYEIYVVEDLIEKKAVMNKDVVASIKTTIQNDKNYEISVLASCDYFKAKGLSPQENYIYLEVSETSLNKNEYDIAIDPAALDRDFNMWSVNTGSEGNGLIEYKETYKAAELLKKALEEKGYKVIIVRKKEEEKNTYGEDGRLKIAYDANCKYYLRLCFSSVDFDYSGFDIAYSAHSSNMFASQIIYHMTRNSDMNISSIYSIGQNKGVYTNPILEGMDKRKIYDSDMWVRESGGKATQAGKYSENAEEGTGSFAKDNIYGMNALDIRLGYLSNKKDVSYWKNHKEEYMNDLAEAISLYLNVQQ